MQIYSHDDAITPPDITRIPPTEFKAAFKTYTDQVKQWLISQGYTGPNTGRIYSTPVGDGYANYMFADKGRQSALILLKYADGYHDPDVKFIPKKTILERITLWEKRSCF